MCVEQGQGSKHKKLLSAQISRRQHTLLLVQVRPQFILWIAASNCRFHFPHPSVQSVLGQGFHLAQACRACLVVGADQGQICSWIFSFEGSLRRIFAVCRSGHMNPYKGGKQTDSTGLNNAGLKCTKDVFKRKLRENWFTHIWKKYIFFHVHLVCSNANRFHLHRF